MKERYISLMEKTLGAYTNEHIEEYFSSVKRDGLTEHGFPRLTANIGILIANGKRHDLLPLFLEMMSFCCESIPRVKAANEFSVREIIFCIIALENKNMVSRAKISEWKKSLASIDPRTCYDKYAVNASDKVNNWACFTAVSEYMRNYIGLCDTLDFVDLQIESQLKYIDRNGMYRDPHEPMVYDLVPRLLFSLLLHFGYNGKHRDTIASHLRRAGLLTLKMQSVSGEIPYGGRSNQFVFNEALIATVFEYEASHYFKEGDVENYSRFKFASYGALDCIEEWLSEEKVRHVKNRFPLESRYGCEKYAYFDKYMITVASYLYCAYLVCVDFMPNDDFDSVEAYVSETSEHFHKYFMRSGEFFLEFDTLADSNYDCSGLGRVHKSFAPSALCLSLPCTATPKYVNNAEDATNLSLCAGAPVDGSLIFATGTDSRYEKISSCCIDEAAYIGFNVNIAGKKSVCAEYCINSDCVEITVSGKGEIAHMLPAFAFDGENHTEISCSENTLTIEYKDWICQYTTNGRISDLNQNAYNRNGCYKAFCALAEDNLFVKITMNKKDPKNIGLRFFLPEYIPIELHKNDNWMCAPFHLAYYEKAFPDAEWTDLVHWIISDWSAKLMRIYNEGDSYELSFYEGPYFIRVSVLPEDMLHIECISDRSKEFCELEFECSREKLLREFIMAVRTLSVRLINELSDALSSELLEFIGVSNRALLKAYMDAYGERMIGENR